MNGSSRTCRSLEQAITQFCQCLLLFLLLLYHRVAVNQSANLWRPKTHPICPNPDIPQPHLPTGSHSFRQAAWPEAEALTSRRGDCPKAEVGARDAAPIFQQQPICIHNVKCGPPHRWPAGLSTPMKTQDAIDYDRFA